MKLRSGQLAVVTGAASGIGSALADALAERGLRVRLLDVEEAALQSTVEALQARGADAGGIVCDVSDAEATCEAAVRIEVEVGAPDLLVNNAGVGGVLGPSWLLSVEDWAWVLGVNLSGVANGLRAFVPAMMRRGSGHVLNVASMAGLTSPPFLGPYVASKHAVVAMTESLATEFAVLKTGLSASVACPGNVESRIHEGDRNRPANLRAASTLDPATAARLQSAFEPVFRQGLISADAAAARILEGVERGALHVFTHPEEHAPAVERAASVRAALETA